MKVTIEGAAKSGTSILAHAIARMIEGQGAVVQVVEHDASVPLRRDDVGFGRIFEGRAVKVQTVQTAKVPA